VPIPHLQMEAIIFQTSRFDLEAGKALNMLEDTSCLAGLAAQC